MTARPLLTLADWLAVIRDRIRELGLSHLEVDHLAGLGQGHTGKILRGKKRLRADTLIRLYRALEIVPRA